MKEGVKKVKVKKKQSYIISYILSLSNFNFTHRERGLPMPSSQSHDKIKPQTTWLIPGLHRSNDEELIFEKKKSDQHFQFLTHHPHSARSNDCTEIVFIPF